MVRTIISAAGYNGKTQAARTASESSGSSQWLQFHNPQCRLEILNTISVPTPYQPKTCVASCSDFALRRNPRMQRRWYGDGTAQIRGWYTHGGRWAGGIFALRRPRPYSRHCGVYLRPSFAPTWTSMGTANGGSRRGIGSGGHSRCSAPPLPSSLLITAFPCRLHAHTVHAAPLRPPRNGRIGFKPPYSKREPRRKASYGVIGEIFPSCA